MSLKSSFVLSIIGDANPDGRKKDEDVADIAVLLAGTDQAELSLHGSKDDIYAWIERTLNRLRYFTLSKKEKSLVYSA